jgi:hypothetical protein
VCSRQVLALRYEGGLGNVSRSTSFRNDKVPPTRVFLEKRLQTIENKGNERRKEHKETTKRLQADAN